MNLRTREKYIVNNARLVTYNNNAIIIELNRGQKWTLVGLYSFSRCAIQRENVTIEIPVSDFRDIFGGE